VGEPIGPKKVPENVLMLAFSVQIYYGDRLELLNRLKSFIGPGSGTKTVES